MRDRPRTVSDLGLTARGGRDPVLTGITVDSRKVMPGFLFAALPGSVAHGADYIGAALKLGAVAILTDAAGAQLAADVLADTTAALIITDDARAALAGAAALWFGAQPKVMVAVTGTNGKTSVASFTRQIWALLGHPAINIGTTGVEGAWTAASGHPPPVIPFGKQTLQIRQSAVQLAERGGHGEFLQ